MLLSSGGLLGSEVPFLGRCAVGFWVFFSSGGALWALDASSLGRPDLGHPVSVLSAAAHGQIELVAGSQELVFSFWRAWADIPGCLLEQLVGPWVCSGRVCLAGPPGDKVRLMAQFQRYGWSRPSCLRWSAYLK